MSPAPQPQAQPAPPTEPLPGEAGPAAPGSYNAQYSTSPKVTGPLLDTPQTVAVIPGTIIEERKATNLIETLRNTPGITIDAGENGFGSGGLQFNIRGFNTMGSVFVDGTRDNGAFPRDTFNVEQVEVFKGPAADNGRGSGGGYVNIVTKTPRLEDFVEAEVGFGFDEYSSETRRRAAFDANQSAGTVGARLNLFIQDGGVAGRDYAEANAWGAAPSLAFGLGTDTRAIFSYEHVERRDVPDSGVAINRDPNATSVPPALPPKYGVGVPGAGPRDYVKNLPRDAFFGLPTDYDNVDADAVVARFEHDLSANVTISNQTRWAYVDRNARYHVGGNGTTFPLDGVPATPNPFFYERANETLTNQTNLAARFHTGAFRHTLSTGVEFTHEEADSFRPHATNWSRTNVDVSTIAGYLYDTIDIDRHWQLVGGVRVEHYDVDISSVQQNGNAGGFDGEKVSETTVGGKLGIVYKPVREGSLYASYGTSVLPPGAYLSNPDISRPGNTGDDTGAFPGYVPDVDPVRFHNYEIGVKWDFFNGALSATAALFRTEKHNVPFVGADLTAGDAAGANVFRGYGEQIVEGIELGIAGAVTEQWKVYGGILFMDSERRHSAYLDDVRRNGGNGGGDYGCVGPVANCTVRTDGDELAFTPNISATFWTTYDVTRELTLGGGVQYVGESWVGRPDDALRVIKNGTYGKLPDYFLVNLMASYDVTENVEVSLNVDNVFDELYLTTANWNASWGYLGPPRSYWLSARYKY